MTDLQAPIKGRACTRAGSLCASTFTFLALIGLLSGAGPSGQAALAQQEGSGPVVDRLEAEPERLQMQAGETRSFTITALDPDGEPVEGVEYRYRAPREALRVREGEVTGLQQGEYTLNAAMFPDDDIGWSGTRPPSVSIPVIVDWPDIAEVRIEAEDYGLYADTHLEHDAAGLHADGSERPDPGITWSSSAPDVASVDRFGRVDAHEPGQVEIRAGIEGQTGVQSYRVQPFPAEELELHGPFDEARAGGTQAGGTQGGEAQAGEVRTGDVLHFQAEALDGEGGAVDDLNIRWSYDFRHENEKAARGAAAEIEDGTFVAEQPGIYTVYAHAGPLTRSKRLVVSERDVVQRIEKVGHGRIDHTRTTDFWVFEGNDGRDYAITGSKDVGGQAFIWDVTDPADPVMTDSIEVDARSVNDVKVSPDNRYAVMTREGASDRRNGVVILDLDNPAHPEVASSYTEGLTGGVHNTWPENDVLFALSAGEKYVILDVSDIGNPEQISEYNHPNSRIHDLILYEGLVLSAEWGNGVVVVDVGNGMAGGSLEDPQYVTNYTLPGGNTHDVIPYHQESTGKLYLFAGDEVMSRRGMPLEGPRGAYRLQYDPEEDEGGVPPSTAGYIHVIDFTDFQDPEKVARYYVEEYGTHNIWIENDMLYQAHYEGGLRLVDISGELKGDLKRQGREIAVYKPFDPAGYVANAPMVWSAIPHKGNIFVSDTNSGLWILNLVEDGDE